MEPLVSLHFPDSQRNFQPGDELTCHYQIDAVPPGEIQAVEASVLWFTEGKGDEDLAVHFFQRRVPGDAVERDLTAMHTIRTHLPNSPLSYAGVIVKVRWCVRLRVFLRRGREVCVEVPFQLGTISPGLPLRSSISGVEMSNGDQRSQSQAAPSLEGTL
jgi:hypothetical protein